MRYLIIENRFNQPKAQSPKPRYCRSSPTFFCNYSFVVTYAFFALSLLHPFVIHAQDTLQENFVDQEGIEALYNNLDGFAKASLPNAAILNRLDPFGGFITPYIVDANEEQLVPSRDISMPELYYDLAEKILIINGSEDLDAQSYVDGLYENYFEDFRGDDQSTELAVGILYTNGVWLDDEELQSSLENFESGILPQDDFFDDKERVPVYASSVTRSQVRGYNVTFTLPNELIFAYSSGEEEAISNITIDVSDGTGDNSISSKSSYVATYTSGGQKGIKIAFDIAGQRYSTTSVVHVYEPSPNNSSRFDTPGNPDFLPPGVDPPGDDTYNVSSEVILGCDGILDKPVLIIEGFDALNESSIADLAIGARNIIARLRRRGFDPVLVNYDDGGASIERNAGAIATLIRQFRTGGGLKSGSEPIGVIGISMGGVVARTALNELERRSIIHEVNVLVSFDSPHRGANVPVGFQKLFDIIDDNWLINRLGLGRRAINDGTKLFESPAAKQLLMRYRSPNPHADHVALQSKLTNDGFPSQNGIRNVALVNGDIGGSRQAPGIGNFDPGDRNLKLETIGVLNLNAVTRTNDINAGTTTAKLWAFWGPIPLIIRNERDFFGPLNYDITPGGFVTNQGSGGIQANRWWRVLSIFNWRLIFSPNITQDFGRDRFSFVPLASSVATTSSLSSQAEFLRSWGTIQSAGGSPMDDVYGNGANSRHVDDQITATSTLINNEFAMLQPACPGSTDMPTPPVPSILFDNEPNFCVEQSIVLYANETATPNLWAYTWNITGPRTLTLTGQNIRFIANAPGRYTVTVTRRFANGNPTTTSSSSISFSVSGYDDPDCARDPGGWELIRPESKNHKSIPSIESSLQSQPTSKMYGDFSDQLNVYPNPVGIEINICSIQSINASDLIIIDPLGREIKPVISSILSDNCLKLDVSQLTSGIYHLATRTASGNPSSTFVISRN